MPVEEGFPGQRLVVAPRPVVARALQQPVTRRLVVTDAGFYPQAMEHRMRRETNLPAQIVIVCASGAGWVRLGGERHRVVAGEALVIPARVAHEYGADDVDPWTIWWIHVEGTDAPELVAAVRASPGRPQIEIRTLDRVVALMDEIVTALERAPSQAKMLIAAGSAWKLLTELAVHQVLPKPGDPLQRAMAFLEQRYDGSVKVPDLAAIVGVSPSHLTALFRKATGGGVLAYQTTVRMARARTLLDTTTATVGDVAMEIGYTDAFYFSRQFRRHHGMSPTDYRNRAAVG